MVAFRLFFGALVGSQAKPGSASTSLTPTTAQGAKLAPVQLSASDTAAFIRALNLWQSQIAPTAATPNGVDLDTTTNRVLDTLQGQMSSSGYASLLAYVQARKKYMNEYLYLCNTRDAHMVCE